MNELIQIKEQNGLFVHKYKRKVFYNNLWDKDSMLIESRGLVTDKEGQIIQYPFTKIFNYKENNTTIPLNQRVLAVEKINGFMAAVTVHEGEVLISTTGSLTSDFVGYAKSLLPPTSILLQYLKNDTTYCFEICHPDDPHIIKEVTGAYLIGARKKYIGSPQFSQIKLDELAEKLSVYRPNWTNCFTFEEMVNSAKVSKKEGFVVYDLESNIVLKLKSPYYSTAKFLARCKTSQKIYNLKIDEEFEPLITYLRRFFKASEFIKIPEQERLNIIRGFYEQHICN